MLISCSEFIDVLIIKNTVLSALQTQLDILTDWRQGWDKDEISKVPRGKKDKEALTFRVKYKISHLWGMGDGSLIKKIHHPYMPQCTILVAFYWLGGRTVWLCSRCPQQWLLDNKPLCLPFHPPVILFWNSHQLHGIISQLPLPKCKPVCQGSTFWKKLT